MPKDAVIVVRIDDAAARRKSDKLKRDEKRAQDRARGGTGSGQGRGGGRQGRGGVTVVPVGKGKALRGIAKAVVQVIALKVLQSESDFFAGFFKRAGEDTVVQPATDKVAKTLSAFSETLAEVEAQVAGLYVALGATKDFAVGQQFLGGSTDQKSIKEFFAVERRLRVLESEAASARKAARTRAIGAAGADVAREIRNLMLGSGAHG